MLKKHYNFHRTRFHIPFKDQLAGFGQVTALEIMDHLFRSYGDIYKIDLEENELNMMGLYNPSESLDSLTEQIEKGQELAHAGG